MFTLKVFNIVSALFHTTHCSAPLSTVYHSNITLVKSRKQNALQLILVFLMEQNRESTRYLSFTPYTIILIMY